MFTGLVQAVGLVRDLSPTPSGSRILVDPADLPQTPPLALGESISISGVCLTLAAPPDSRGLLAFDVVPQTLSCTSLAGLKPGSRVNLERSVTPMTLLGGHVVQGHVDGLAEVLLVQPGDDYRVRFRPRPLPDANPMEYLIPKGSVSLDGVSLTIAALGPDWFEVALIPTTLTKTTLSDFRQGDLVNIEFDALAKTIVHWLRHFSGR